MSMKKRLLKIVGIALTLVLVFGYFLFTTLFFNPMEGDWGHSLSALTPRNVDLWVAKEKLGDLFEPFPEVVLLETVAHTAAWRDFDDSPEQAQLIEDLGIPELLRQVEEGLAQAPISVDPLAIFGGRAVALAGDLDGRTAENADWALYGRVNWMGKLGVSLIPFLGLEDQGMAVEEVSDSHFKLSGGQLQRNVHVGRVLDVVVIATNGELVEHAKRLSQAAGEDSLRLATTYESPVLGNMGPDREEVELFANLRTTFDSLGLPATWPDPSSESFSEAMTARLIQAPACKNVAGVLGFDGGLTLDLEGKFSSEKISDFQARVYRNKGFEQDHVLRDIARMAPPDTAALVYLHGPVEDILREVLASTEPALRQNIEDVFRSTGRWASLSELVEEIGGAAHDRLLLIVREEDYGPIVALHEGSGQEMSPETDGSTVFAFSLVTWLRGNQGIETVNSIRDAIGRNPDKFGLQGGVAGDPGYYRYEVGGMDTREFWSPFIPGTGMIATVVDGEGRCIVTNHERMLDQVIKCMTRQRTSLSDNPTFQALLNSSTPASNLLVWVNPRAATETLRALGRVQVDLDLRSRVDWAMERRRQELRVLPNMFPGKQRNQLSEEQRTILDDAIDVELQEWFKDHARDEKPVLLAALERKLNYVRTIKALLASLRLDPKKFNLTLRALMPLDE